MKAAAWGFSGLVLGGVYVLVVGVLSIQAKGQRVGAVFDLSNSVVEVTTARQPIVPMLAVAAVSALVMYALVFGARRRARSDRLALVGGFSVVVLALVVTALQAPVLRIIEPGIPLGESVAWRGWVDEGGVSPAVHVLLFLAIGSAWLFPGSRRAHDGPQDRKALEIELDGEDG